MHPLSRNCRENKPLFVAGPFDQAFNISKKLDIKEVGPYLCAAFILSSYIFNRVLIMKMSCKLGCC